MSNHRNRTIKTDAGEHIFVEIDADKAPVQKSSPIPFSGPKWIIATADELKHIYDLILSWPKRGE